jgi:hypothetical protein
VLLQKIYWSLRSVLLIFLVFCVLLLCVFTVWVPCCDFRVQTKFGSSLPPVGFTNETLKLPLLLGKSYLITMAKASTIQIAIQTLEPVSTESKRYFLFGVKMQEPMTEFLCSPIMCLYGLGSVLWFPRTNEIRFVSTSSCL